MRAQEASPKRSPEQVAETAGAAVTNQAAGGKLTRILTFLGIVLPLAGVAAAAIAVWGWGFSWIDLVVFFVMYLLSAVGITVGFHRLFVHRSFETYRWVKAIFGVLGSMAVQGPLLQWVALHRRHHQFSDQPEDPHTPHHHGTGLGGVIGGFWHAHVGWLFRPLPEGIERYAQDVARDPVLRAVSRLFPLWVAAGLVLPGLFGWWLGGEFRYFWTGIIWGGLVRVFLVHHITWAVNSACHLWGQRPYATADESRNNVIFGYLALGEGWHNTHHAFPTSARHGLAWWQLDVSYWLIRLLAACRLAWNVRVPTEARLEAAQAGQEAESPS